MVGYDEVGFFEGTESYLTLDPMSVDTVAEVLCECEVHLQGNGPRAVSMEVGYGATNDHTTVGSGLSGTQAQEVPGQIILFAQCTARQTIPANGEATFKMRVFPNGNHAGTLVRMTVLRFAL